MPSSGEIKRPGGYQNVSLQIGPPIRYENAGRYICLVNNPEGHAHKEMFLEIDHASFDATRDYNQGMWIFLKSLSYEENIIKYFATIPRYRNSYAVLQKEL